MRKVYLLVENTPWAYPSTRAEAFLVRMQAMRAVQEWYGVDPDSWQRHHGISDGFPTTYDWVTVDHRFEDGTRVFHYFHIYEVDLHPRP